MTTFPGSPRLMKGAIVGMDPFNPLASVVVFQYNPETLTRTLTARAAGAQANRGEALRLAGPPEETIRLEVEIDAADQLETADPIATSMGLYPTLSALEMLLYPKSALVIAETSEYENYDLEDNPDIHNYLDRKFIGVEQTIVEPVAGQVRPEGRKARRRARLIGDEWRVDECYRHDMNQS